MRLTCLVDNHSIPPGPSTGLVRKSGNGRRFIAQHGFSILLETPDEGRLIFDTGASPLTISHNLGLLDLEPADIDLVLISHGHSDHSAGLPPFIEAGVPIHCSPSAFTGERFVERDGRFVTASCDTDLLRSIKASALYTSDDLRKLAPGIYASGYVPRRAEYAEYEYPNHFWRNDGDGVVEDLIPDDQSLYLDTDDGVVIICGCCHAGVLNVVAHAREHFEREILLLMGGFHLNHAPIDSLLKTAGILKKEGVRHIAPMHCSGFEATRVFSDFFEHFELMGVGDEILIDWI